MPKRILFVFTSADKTLTGAQTGWYLPEAAHPYYVLAPKYDIDFAAPKGANPPVDEGSVAMFVDDKKFLDDPVVQQKLASATPLADVDPAAYDAVFYPGGHGPVLDLASDPVNAKIASEFFRAGKPTAAVCHGPAALVGATDAEGNPIVKGKRTTCFTNAEEEAVQKVKDIPFLVESRLKELGSTFENADLWAPKVIVDGILITGQNPASSKGVGEAIDQALSA